MSIYDLTKRLVSIPSVTSDLDEVHNVYTLIEKFYADTPDAQIIHHDIDGRPAMTIQNFVWVESDIVLSGHIDVVPPTTPDQFTLREEDGKLYARGAGDMKGGVAIMMQVMHDICSGKLSTDKKICLMITADEETGGESVRYLVEEKGYRATVALVPDSGSLERIVYAEKGILSVIGTAPWKATHSSMPRTGENPIDKVISLYHHLKNSIEDPAKLYGDDHWSSSVQLTVINAWEVSNVIPGEASFAINIRFTPEEWEYDELVAYVADAVKQYGCVVNRTSAGHPAYTDPAHPIIQQYVEAARGVVGGSVYLDKTHGATDGRFFAQHGSILIMHEPTQANIHGKDEYVVIDDLEKIYTVMSEFIANYTG